MARLWPLLALVVCVAGYQKDEKVAVYYNKVTPRNNPQEVYSYLDLPLCRSASEEPEDLYKLTLGQALEGDFMTDSRLDVRFLNEMKQRRICTKALSASESLKLREAIRSQYWLQLSIDGLPVWGPLGKWTQSESEKLYVFTHFTLLVYYNDQRIVQVLYQPQDLLEVESPDEAPDQQIITFYYSVVWAKTSQPYEGRMSTYKDATLLESSAHWVAVLNSLLIMLLMCGFVFLILSLTKEHAPHDIDTMGAIISESPGWKLIAGEVFRAPTFLLIFTAFVGAGTQLLAVAFLVFSMAFFVPIYWESGLMTTLTLVLYCLACFFNGFRSGSFYLQHRGKHWLKSMLVSHLLLPTLFGLAHMPHATLSVVSSTFPTFRILELLAIFLCVGTPLHVEGTILGRKYFGDAKYPYQISIVRQPILRHKLWYQKPVSLICLGGLLPFICAVCEVYLVFNCWWGAKVYYTYGFGLTVFVILLITQCCVSVICTYLFLCAEDYRWPWVSFLSSASTAAYLLGYAAYYYVFRTNMSGLTQFAAYFTYVGFAAIVVFLVSGMVGHLAAAWFVRVVYTRVKHE